MQELNLNNKRMIEPKSSEEREQLKMLKKEHKKRIIDAGLDPKKNMNPKPHQDEK